MRYCKLHELCTNVIDCPHSTPEWKTEGIRVVRNFNLHNGNLDFTDGYFVDEETYYNRIKRAKPEAGDIIISREAPMGVVAIVPENLQCCLGQRLVLLKVDKTKVNPIYLLFVLMSDFVQTQFRRADSTGSIVSNLCIPDLKDIIIPVLEKNEDNISNLLDHINRKLILNKKINDNLHQQLKVLYDYWFTQFDYPDSSGKPYKLSGGTMVSSDKVSYKIPAGWKVETLLKNSLSNILKPGVEYFTSKTYLATADVNGTDISSGSVIDYETREKRANMQPTLNSVWFAKMKNSKKHLYLNKEMKQLVDECILSTGVCGLQCTEESFEYISSFIEHSYFELQKNTLAHGATQEAVNNDDLSNVAIVIPSSEVLNLFHQRTSGIYSQISKNICENQELTKLRDWLLPMLMNGQATISD